MGESPDPATCAPRKIGGRWFFTSQRQGQEPAGFGHCISCAGHGSADHAVDHWRDWAADRQTTFYHPHERSVLCRPCVVCKVPARGYAVYQGLQRTESVGWFLCPLHLTRDQVKRLLPVPGPRK